MAEAFNSLFKAECIRNPTMRPKSGWASVRDIEIAVAEYVDWFNHRRLHGRDRYDLARRSRGRVLGPTLQQPLR